MKLFDFQRETLALISITSALFVLSGGDFITNPRRDETATAISRSYVWCEQWNSFCLDPFNTTYLCWRFEAIFADPNTQDLYDRTQGSGFLVCEFLAFDMLAIKQSYNDGEYCQTNPGYVKWVAAVQMLIPLIIFLPNLKEGVTLHAKILRFIFAHAFNMIINAGFAVYLLVFLWCFGNDTSFVVYILFSLFSLINIVLLTKLRKQTKDAALKSCSQSLDQNLAMSPLPPQASAVPQASVVMMPYPPQ